MKETSDFHCISLRVCVLIRVSRKSASAVTIKYSSVAPQRATRDGGDGGLGVDRHGGMQPSMGPRCLHS